MIISWCLVLCKIVEQERICGLRWDRTVHGDALFKLWKSDIHRCLSLNSFWPSFLFLQKHELFSVEYLAYYESFKMYQNRKRTEESLTCRILREHLLWFFSLIRTLATSIEMACKTMNEFDERLLAAVRAKNSAALEEHLSTVDHPETYLNRLYDEANEQSCTLLMIALMNEDERILQMLLTRFQPDLQVSNSIRLSDIDPSRQMFFNVTILWAAAAINHFGFVKLLVEHGANVNSTTRSNSSPLRCACFTGNLEMARYLISQGADPQIAKIKNDTNLMLSVNREHLEMVTYLVDEVHCDVNERDDDGHSALHDAVNSGSLALVTFLLQRGARNFPALHNRMSPLMWAAEKRQISIVEAMSSYCSLLENIEAQELLASALVCRDSDVNLDLAIAYFTQAIEQRLSHHLPKPLRSTSHMIFDHRQECQTVEQLMKIRSDLDQIYTEALLVRERLLGLSNDEYRLSLRCLGIRLSRQERISRAFDYWIYELHLRQDYSLPIEPGYLRRFSVMLNSMSSAPSSNLLQNLLAIIEVVHRELQRNEKDADVNLPTLLTLITIASQVESSSIIDG